MRNSLSFEKNIVPSKDGKEEHYVTNKGTFTPDDVVGF